MKLFILGATGGIGRHLVRLALERGHFVTAYVRSPKKIVEVHERLKVMQGERLQRRRNGRFHGESRRRSFFLRTERTAFFHPPA
jgi:nucleoside-diphosphate-sugar epimerase